MPRAAAPAAPASPTPIAPAAVEAAYRPRLPRSSPIAGRGGRGLRGGASRSPLAPGAADRLAEARRTAQFATWSDQADRAAAEGRWADAVIQLENIRSLDPNYPDLARRLQVAGSRRRVADLHPTSARSRLPVSGPLCSPPARSWPRSTPARPTRTGWSAGAQAEPSRRGAASWPICTTGRVRPKPPAGSTRRSRRWPSSSSSTQLTPTPPAGSGPASAHRPAGAPARRSPRPQPTPSHPTPFGRPPAAPAPGTGPSPPRSSSPRRPRRKRHRPGSSPRWRPSWSLVVVVGVIVLRDGLGRPRRPRPTVTTSGPVPGSRRPPDRRRPPPPRPARYPRV